MKKYFSSSSSFLQHGALYSEAQVANEDKHRLIVTTDLGELIRMISSQ
ncbi:MAG: hypothetical protein ACLUE2_11420 [Bacteroides cellulosilyticus]